MNLQSFFSTKIILYYSFHIHCLCLPFQESENNNLNKTRSGLEISQLWKWWDKGKFFFSEKKKISFSLLFACNNIESLTILVSYHSLLAFLRFIPYSFFFFGCFVVVAIVFFVSHIFSLHSFPFALHYYSSSTMWNNYFPLLLLWLHAKLHVVACIHSICL